MCPSPRQIAAAASEAPTASRMVIPRCFRASPRTYIGYYCLIGIIIINIGE